MRLVYEAVFGTADFDEETGPIVILILLLRDDDSNVRDVAVATVRPNPRVPGCDVWDFMTNNVDDSQFEAIGEITLLP